MNARIEQSQQWNLNQKQTMLSEKRDGLDVNDTSALKRVKIMKQTIQFSSTLFSLCLVVALSACTNDYTARSDANLMKTNSTSGKSTSKGRAKNAQQQGQGFQGGGIVPNGGRTRTDGNTGQDGEGTKPVIVISSETEAEVDAEIEKITQAVKDDAEKAKANEDARNNQKVKTSSKVDIATLVPSNLLNILNDHLSGKSKVVDGNAELTIDDVDTVLASVNAYLQNLALVDFTNEAQKNEALNKVLGLKTMFEAMAENATGVEEKKVIAKLQKQQSSLAGVEKMIEDGHSGTDIRDWVMQNNQAGSQFTTPIVVKKDDNGDSPRVLEKIEKALPLSSNMNRIYCALKGLQDNHGDLEANDCANQAHTDAELQVMMDQFLEDLPKEDQSDGEEYAVNFAATLKQINQNDELMQLYPAQDQQTIKNLVGAIDKRAKVHFGTPKVDDEDEAEAQGSSSTTRKPVIKALSIHKPLVLTNPSPTPADTAVMDELGVLKGEVSNYLYNESASDSPQEVLQNKNEFMDRLDAIGIKCDGECSDAQKPVFQQQRDAIEREIKFYDQPEAKKLTDEIGSLDPATVDADVIEQAHLRIKQLPTPEQQDYAAQQWSNKLADARATNPDGITQDERQAIVADFSDSPQADQSVEDFLQEQEKQLDKKFNLPKRKAAKAEYIQNKLTPEERDEYLAERSKIEDAKAQLLKAQVNAAVENQYPQATYGDDQTREQAEQTVEQDKTKLKAKIDQLDETYLSDPAAKDELITQAELPAEDQFKAIDQKVDAQIKAQTPPVVSQDSTTGPQPTKIIGKIHPNATATDKSVMDDLDNLNDAVSSYMANQSSKDAPHEVNLKKQEYLGMLDGIDARCEGECSEAQKPLYEANRDALERKIRYFDQPAAKTLTDQIAALDPAQIDSATIDAVHDHISSLPSRDQKEFAAQQWSDKLAQARALNPDGITEADRQAIVADFDEPLAQDQSVDDYLEAQKQKINAEYGLSEQDSVDWDRIKNQMTPAQKAAYKAKHQKVEDAQAALYQAQMDAAVEDQYAQATFGDQAQKAEANKELQAQQAQINAKTAELDESYLSDPSVKSRLMAQSAQPLAAQYKDIEKQNATGTNQSGSTAQQDGSTQPIQANASQPDAMDQLSAYLDNPAIADSPAWKGDTPLTVEDKRLLAPYNPANQELNTLDDAKALADSLPTQAQKDAGTPPDTSAAKKAKDQVGQLKAVVKGTTIDPARTDETIDPRVREALQVQSDEQEVETLGDAQKLIQDRQAKAEQDVTKDQMEQAVNAQEAIAADLAKHEQELPARENRSEQKEYLQTVIDGKKPIKIIDRAILAEPLDPEIKTALEAQNTTDKELETVGDAVELVREKQKAQKAAEKNQEADPETAKQAAKEMKDLQASIDTVETIRPEEVAKESTQSDILEAIAAGDVTSDQLTPEQKQEPLAPAIQEALSKSTPEGMPLDTVGNAAKVIEKHQDVANGNDKYDGNALAFAPIDTTWLDKLDLSLGKAIDQANASSAPDALTKDDLRKEVKSAVDAQFAALQLVQDAKLRGDMAGLKLYEKIDLIIAQQLQGKRWNEVDDYKSILQNILRSYVETLNPNVQFATSRYTYPGGASEVIELKLPSISQAAIQMLHDGVNPLVFSSKIQQDLAGTLSNTGIDYLVYSLKHQLADHVNDNFLKKEMPILLVKNSGMNNSNNEYLYLVAQYLDAAQRISLGSLPLTTVDAPPFDISIVFSIEQVIENL